MSVVRQFLASAMAASVSGSIAEVATIPFDTVKVRLQMQNKMPSPDLGAELSTESANLNKQSI